MYRRSSIQRQAHLPALGRRGEGWVVAQLLLLAGVLLAPLLDRGRTGAAAWAGAAVLLAAGAALLVASGAGLGRALTPLPAPRETGELQTGGVYRIVRHPMYTGALLVAFGWTVLFESLAALGFAVAVAVFFGLKARREEAWLVERFAGYEAYRQRTRHMLVPFLY